MKRPLFGLWVVVVDKTLFTRDEPLPEVGLFPGLLTEIPASSNTALLFLWRQEITKTDVPVLTTMKTQVLMMILNLISFGIINLRLKQ